MKFEQGPPAGGMTRHLESGAAFAASALRIDKSAKVLESVGGDKAGSPELPQPVLDLAREQSGRFYEFRQKRRAAPAQRFEDLAAGLRYAVVSRRSIQQPGCVFTKE